MNENITKKQACDASSMVTLDNTLQWNKVGKGELALGIRAMKSGPYKVPSKR